MAMQEARLAQPGERKPAPGELALVQAFINSADLEEGKEAFVSPEALCAWLVRRELLPTDASLTAADLARALRAREALRDLLEANSGGAPDAASVAFLNAEGLTLPLIVRFAADSRATLVPEVAGLAGALAQLFAIIQAAQIDGTWGRLRSCRNHICRWAFYDASKNQSGHWCTMAICGSRRKTRAYRARQREADAE